MTRRTNRRKLHNRYVHQVEALFAAHGIVAERVKETPVGSPKSHEWLVGTLRVRLVVSRARRYNHSTYQAGRRYCYRYVRWVFNFHRHGRVVETYEAAVCVGERGGGPPVFWVIPRAAIKGKTLHMHIGMTRPRGSRYDVWRDRWDLLQQRHEDAKPGDAA